VLYVLAKLVRWCQFNVVYKLLSCSRSAKKSMFTLFLQVPDDPDTADVVTVKAHTTSEVHKATGDVQTAVAALKVYICDLCSVCCMCWQC
jgi:hypothetical protein